MLFDFVTKNVTLCDAEQIDSYFEQGWKLSIGYFPNELVEGKSVVIGLSHAPESLNHISTFS